MKKILFISTLILVVGLWGCENDALNTFPTIDIDEHAIFTSVDGAEVAIAGAYNRLRMWGAADASPSGHIVGLMSTMDAACDDVISTTKAWMRGWTSNENGGLTINTSPDNTLIFKMFYVVINNCNAIIKYLPDASGDETQKNHIMGQALTMRALSYFYLVRYYQHPVTVAGEAPSIPYVKEPGINYHPRATVNYVYDRIVEDLTNAVDLLEGFNRGANKSLFDRQIAQGILANVYLTMENFQGAAEMANQARQGYALMDAETFRSGFNNGDVSEAMWVMSQTTEQSLRNKIAAHWWANNNRARIGAEWTFTWNSLYVAPHFVALFETGDARYQFWKTATPPLHFRSDKFFDIVDNNADIIIMRAAEMYLVEAEALLRGNIDPAEAKNLLNTLQVTRGASPTEATIDNIKIERRKELYGEGHRWFDIIRYREELVKGPGNQFRYTIPSKSNLFRFQIPQREINFNPEISESDQNELTGFWPN